MFKSYDQCFKTFDFLIVCISKNLNLRVKQSIALLAEENKYLTHIVIKGFKIEIWKDNRFL